MTRWLAVAGFLGLLVLITACSGPTTVTQSENCLRIERGKVKGLEGAGFHFYWVGGVDCYSARTLVYEAADDPKQSQADYTDVPVNADSRDPQHIDAITYTAWFRVANADVEALWRNQAKDMDEVFRRVVQPLARTRVRSFAGTKTAEQLRGDLAALSREVEVQLKADMTAQGVTLDRFLLRKIDFNDEYESALNAIQVAQQNATRAVEEARAANTRADADAYARTALANAEAAAIKTRGEAEASAQRALADVLRDCARCVELETAKHLNDKTVIISGAGGVTPIVTLPVPAQGAR